MNPPVEFSHGYYVFIGGTDDEHVESIWAIEAEACYWALKRNNDEICTKEEPRPVYYQEDGGSGYRNPKRVSTEDYTVIAMILCEIKHELLAKWVEHLANQIEVSDLLSQSVGKIDNPNLANNIAGNALTVLEHALASKPPESKPLWIREYELTDKEDDSLERNEL